MRHATKMKSMILILLLLAVAAPSTASAATSASWAPHLDRRIVSTRINAYGLQPATWYGPGLYGNRTACGTRLARETWGIAHRTLPCGTLVTLATGGRSISVRVVDRGPYSGATVDLTERTRRYLGFVSGSVRMNQVRTFRMLPLDAR